MSNEIWHSYDEAGILYSLIFRKTDDKVYDRVADTSVGQGEIYWDFDNSKEIDLIELSNQLNFVLNIYDESQ
jgi:hypothetical protein